MSYPVGVITRELTYGAAATLETGDDLGMRVTITASRSLVWLATGAPHVVRARTEGVNPGEAGSMLLPVTDQTGWGDGQGNALTVEDGNQTHLYVARVVYTDANGKAVGKEQVSAPFALPQGDGPVDLDVLLPAGTASGATITVPDAWSQLVSEAEAAAAAAQAALIDSEALIRTTVTGDLADPGSDIGSTFVGMVESEAIELVPPLVAASIAADDTVAAAAAAAVDGALDDAGVMTGAGEGYSGDDVEWSVVDEDDRRSWLEVASDGGPTDNAAKKMTPKVSGELGYRDVPLPPGVDPFVWAILDDEGRRSWLEIAPSGGPTANALSKIVAPVVAQVVPDAPAGSGVGFAVVDSTGRISELSVGADGNVADQILARWAARMIAKGYVLQPGVDPVDLSALPSKLNLAATFEHRLYPKQALAALSADQKVKVLPYAETDQLSEYVTTTPPSATTYTMTWEVYDRTLTLIKSKNIAATVRALTAVPGHRLLPIGDSITNAETYHKESASALGGRCVGTRTFDGGVTAHEGRGGWSVALYTTTIGSTTVPDSPFLFPDGVAGDKYLGNVHSWAQMIAGSSTFNGWQLAVKGWNNANPMPFDSSGYPITPTAGDVVCDPSHGVNKFREYVSGAWQAMSPQPSVSLDYAKYLARWSPVFTATGAPTQVSIMLGTNDFFAQMTDSALAAYMAGLGQLVAMFRAVSATLPIHICCPPTGGPADLWTTTATKFEFDARMRRLAAAIIAAYDTPAALADHIHVVPFTAAVTESNLGDWVHPNTTGHRQMKPYLIGSLLKEGV